VGRPRNRWEDNVQKDAMSVYHIRNWKSVSRNRQNWGKKIGKTMTRIRAECQLGGENQREMYLILLSFCVLEMFHFNKQPLLPCVVIRLISVFLSASHLKR